MAEEDVLGLKTRRKIYNHILRHPGLHERELSRQLDIPLGTIDYHLFYLKKKGILTVKSDERFSRYYVSGEVGIKDKKVLAVLRQKVSRKIVIFLLLNPHSLHRDICKYLGLARSTTSFHLNKLSDLEIILRIEIGRETKYYIKEVNHVSDILITYQKSFFDDAVDRFVDSWLEMHPRYLRKTKKKERDLSLLSLFETLQLRR
ncbi:MAG: winged helix-turn-helix transcriptional regulator [Thermoplasmatales archaeon]|nr:winged helix-turn-helix transcriptional regulator [Thermoplasmatales archaeon]